MATTSIKKGLKTMVDRSGINHQLLIVPKTLITMDNMPVPHRKQLRTMGELPLRSDVKTDDNGSPRERTSKNNEQEWKPTTQPTIATAWEE